MDKGAASDHPRPLPGQVTNAVGAAAPASAVRDGEVRAEALEPDSSRSGTSGQRAGREGRGAGHQSGGRYGRRERGPFYAALDLGTNNCRLLIAEPAGETFR